MTRAEWRRCNRNRGSWPTVREDITGHPYVRGYVVVVRAQVWARGGFIVPLDDVRRTRLVVLPGGLAFSFLSWYTAWRVFEDGLTTGLAASCDNASVVRLHYRGMQLP